MLDFASNLHTGMEYSSRTHRAYLITTEQIGLWATARQKLPFVDLDLKSMHATA